MALINDNQDLVSVVNEFGRKEHIYDDGFGPLWVMRDSMGIMGIIRAQTWEEAYEIAEDELFPEAESIKQILHDLDDAPSIEALIDDAVFQENYGFRPNGPNQKDKHNHGIYQKDLNGEALDRLTEKLAERLRLTITVEGRGKPDWE
jgi:hypothetical protein